MVVSTLFIVVFVVTDLQSYISIVTLGPNSLPHAPLICST